MTIKENNSAFKKEILVILIVFSSIGVWLVKLPIYLTIAYLIISVAAFIFLFFRKIEINLKINTIEINLSLFGKVYEKHFIVFNSIQLRNNSIIFTKNNVDLFKIGSKKAIDDNKLDTLKVTIPNKSFNIGNKKNAKTIYDKIEEFYNLKRIFGTNA